jgi:hypothetical protein
MPLMTTRTARIRQSFAARSSAFPSASGSRCSSATAAAVALLATPALGIQGKVGALLGVDGRSRLHFVAILKPVAGHGTGTVDATPVRAFTHVGSDRTIGFAQAISVRVEFGGLSGAATVARIRVTAPRRPSGKGFAVRLCGPCSPGTTVVIRRRGLILALFDGRATAEIATAAHPNGELRGPIGVWFTKAR